MRSPNIILSRILFFLYLVAVAFVCFMRPDRLPDVQKDILGIPSDKVAHFLMFFPFPILTFLSFGKPNKKPWGAVLFAFLNLLAGSAVAALTEYVQGLLPYRTKDFSDFKADFLALVISTLLVFLVDISGIKKRSR